jgi:hypothetical protein
MFTSMSSIAQSEPPHNHIDPVTGQKVWDVAGLEPYFPSIPRTAVVTSAPFGAPVAQWYGEWREYSDRSLLMYLPLNPVNLKKAIGIYKDIIEINGIKGQWDKSMMPENTDKNDVYQLYQWASAGMGQVTYTSLHRGFIIFMETDHEKGLIGFVIMKEVKDGHK